jgi:hypothetical protein
LLSVVVGENCPFLCDPVDVWRLIANYATAIGADIVDADIVAKDNQDIRPIGFGERSSSMAKGGRDHCDCNQNQALHDGLTRWALS